MGVYGEGMFKRCELPGEGITRDMTADPRNQSTLLESLSCLKTLSESFSKHQVSTSFHL